MKNQRGITLIALVITIIVLLILAGVSISMVIGDNGIIKQANDAKTKTHATSEQEQVELALLAAKMLTYTNGGEVDADAINKQLSDAGVNATAELKDGELVVTFSDTKESYKVNGEIVTKVETPDLGNGDTGTTPETNKFTQVLADLNSGNTTTYLAKAQALGQDSSITDIAIGTDGEVVNLNYWDYYLTDDGTVMSLGDGDASYRYGGYKGPIEGGAIKGKIPQYIYKASNQTVYAITKLDQTFRRGYDENWNVTFESKQLTICPEIPTTVTSMKATFFDTSIVNCVIPDNVKVFEMAGTAGVFGQCNYLTSVKLSKNLENIDSYAFAGCNALTNIEVSAQNPNYDSRNNCNAIIETSTNTLIVGGKNTIIPNDVTRLEDSAFAGRTGLTNITIPNSVTSMGNSVFSSCTDLNNVIISSNVTKIGAYTFSGCTSLSSIVIPSGVTRIGSDAFRACKNLSNITIPKSLTTIDTSAFEGSGVTTVNYEGTAAEWNSINMNYYNTVLKNANIQYNVTY